MRLTDDDIDVCLIQETKLRRETKTPRFQGYVSLRFDRPSQNGGGGLLTLLRESIIFERIGCSSRSGTEMQSLRVRLGRRSWVTINNIYCPPSRSHSSNPSSLILAPIEVPPNSITVGDFNAHNPMWDPHQPKDQRGEEVLDWVIEKELTILNDGSHTRWNSRWLAQKPPSNPIPSPHGPSLNPLPSQDPFQDPSHDPPKVPLSGGKSTPDLTIVGTSLADRCSWCTIDGIGKSDHLPILLSISTSVGLGSVHKGRIAWRSSGVDWAKYAAHVDASLESSPIAPPGTSVHRAYKDLCATIVNSAKVTVGTVKPGKRLRTWETAAVREAIKKRNRLRHKLSTNRAEWLDACCKAKEAIAEAKTSAWRELLEDGSGCDARTWKIIRSLNGTPDANSPNEAMVHNGRLVTSDRRKADIFASHYAGVARLHMSKEDRDENRAAKQMLRRLRRVRDSGIACSTPNFSLTELNTALSNMKSRGAPGPDNISPPLLKHLGPGALMALLRIFNASLHSGEIPQMWRSAIIVPVLKAGKPPSQQSSYRPISLTSCVMKVMERMLSNRLYDLAETNHWFSDQQAGFRKARGVEDQILRITQRISDGFQRKEKSILVLLDFSKAYDTIWRQRLLLSLANLGIPPIYTLWLSAALLNRQAQVRFNGVLSGCKKMGQGLPQGSVLAPILFLFYINNLAGHLPADVTTSLYADDVAILASSTSLVEAQQRAQRAVDVVHEWSKGWKINLNGAKSELSTFSMSNADSSWRPNITINGTAVRFEPHPRLLGVILDRRLTFGSQVAAVKRKASSKIGLLSAVAHSKWGWRKKDLRKVYFAHFRSVLTFASSAWQPWLPDTRIAELETVQNKCLRLITGQGKSTPVEALRLEANVPSLASAIAANCLRSREKALRLPVNHPRRLALEEVAPRRLKSRQRDFRQTSERWSESCGLSDLSRIPLTYFGVRPWERGLPPDIVFPFLEGVSGREAPQHTIQQAALSRARAINAKFNIYSDGSASAGLRMGGAGAVVTTGDPSNPVVVANLQKRGALYTSSYDEELRAMQMSLDWIDLHLSESDHVAIFTDSQSLCMALVGGGDALDYIRSRISARLNITIQWIPGHSGVPGNELADAAAKLAAKTSGPTSPISYGGICAHIRQSTRDPPPSHARTKAVYAALTQSREDLLGCRADQTLVAQLRSGHYIGLRATQHRFNEDLPDTCNLCGEGGQDLEHWLDCPATAAERHALFGEYSGGLDCLTRFPREAATLARKTLGENLKPPSS